MYTGLLHLHSTLRYILLLLLVVTVIKASISIFGNKHFTEGDRKLGLYTLIATHLQLVVGLVLYFVSPVIEAGMADIGETMKNSTMRFYVVEHFVTMILAVLFITIGYSRVKRTKEENKKVLRTAVFYGIGLVLVLLRMPWDRW